MKANQLDRIYHVIGVLALVAAACSVAAPEPTATPTATVPPTKTPRPTSTPRPTRTPDHAATKQYGDFQTLLSGLQEDGYIESTEGRIMELDPFTESWAQINWYQWWPVTHTNGDFAFSGHLEWSTASRTPEDSGCGIVFGAQGNEDHYSVFLTNKRILFLMARGTYAYEVGKTSGSGRADFENPASADLIVTVKGQSSYVLVDGEATQYTLSADQTTRGDFALSLLSGTNKDYGTRCRMTDMMLWIGR
jgi:hypothetical protein